MPQNFPALLHAGISPRNRVKELKKIGETHHGRLHDKGYTPALNLQHDPKKRAQKSR